MLTAFLLASTVGLPASASPSPKDRANVALTTAIVQRVGDRIWPDWSATPFPIVFVKSDMEATLVFAGGPTIVIGEQPYTAEKTRTSWSVALLHEHFHQWQQYWPGYFDAINGLNLSRGDRTGMWMLNYAFPYKNRRVDERYARMAAALADALNGGSVARYLQARTNFKKALAARDYRYFAFQCWQEGAARYTEIAAARLAARAHQSDPWFLTGKQAAALKTQGDATYAQVLKRLRTIPLARAQRVNFYAIGAGEALLLDRVAPDWRKNYLDPRMDLGALFPR